MPVSECWRGRCCRAHDELMGIDFWRQNTWKLLHQKRNNTNKVVAECNAVMQQKENKIIEYSLVNF